MITNEEARQAIEKYQKEHPVPFPCNTVDVTAISSKEGADIITQTIEKISKQIDKDTELWCICEMAKMYMQGVRPVYPVRPHGKWEYKTITDDYRVYGRCSNCLQRKRIDNYCPNCGADMRGDSHGQ